MDKCSGRELVPGSGIGSAREERECAMQTRREVETMFDRWIREILRERYTAALREPLPEAMTRLLDGVDAQPAPITK